jgi:hypothetical protein
VFLEKEPEPREKAKNPIFSVKGSRGGWVDSDLPWDYL